MFNFQTNEKQPNPKKMQGKKITERLQQNLDVSLAQSSLIFDEGFQEGFSIIDELHAVDNFEHEEKEKFNTRKNTKGPQFISERFRQNQANSQKKIEEMIGLKTISKINKQNKIAMGTSLTPMNDRWLDGRDERSVSNTGYYFRAKQIRQDDGIDSKMRKLKQEQANSIVLRIRDFILNEFLDRCTYCGGIQSELSKEGLVCTNSLCRIRQIGKKTYPFLSILYEAENPSSNQQNIKHLLDLISLELGKLEQWRGILEKWKNALQNILESSQKKTEGNISSFLNQISNLRKKSRINKNGNFDIQLQELRKKQDYELHFDNFFQWEKLSSQKQNPFQQNLKKAINDFRPLYFRDASVKMLPFISSISDNRRHRAIVLSVKDSLPSGFNLSGIVEKMTILVDGSFCWGRQMFMMVESVEQLILEFKTKKTSRQLKQIFYSLPKAKSLVTQFDFRTHSHISSETFPILTRVFQHNSQSLSITIKNARQEIMKELATASKSLTPKLRLRLCIELSPYVDSPLNKNKEEMKYSDTMVLKTLIKNASRSLIDLDLRIPLNLDYENIHEYLVNNDYHNLISVNIEGLNQKLFGSMAHLSNTIVNKRKHLLAVILHQKSLKNSLKKEKVFMNKLLKLLI